VREGDALLALASTGLHTNGYSLARKLLFDVAKLTPESRLEETGSTVADELLQVHRSYLRPIQLLIEKGSLAGAAHITGGGITDNLPRVLPKGLAAAIETGSWKTPPLFEMLREIGQVPEEDWRRTFNLGVGMIFVVPRAKLGVAQKALKKAGEKPWIIGEIIKQRRGKAKVEYR
jgi:phosphoribosylformylglycinamidine cyclo-ligase